jgi:hypothetical protein
MPLTPPGGTFKLSLVSAAATPGDTRCPARAPLEPMNDLLAMPYATADDLPPALSHEGAIWVEK